MHTTCKRLRQRWSVSPQLKTDRVHVDYRQPHRQVRNYVSGAVQKQHARNRPQAVEIARQQGWTEQGTEKLPLRPQLALPARWVPRKHPLRVVKQFADRALRELSPVFDQMYAAGGRPSIPPERLLKASLLIALYSIRSETAFCEELDYRLLYRWFLDMGLLEPSFDPTVFTKNRRRLLKHDVAQRFVDEGVRQ